MENNNQPNPPILAILVSKGGQLITRPMTDAPEQLVMPLNLVSDQRLFLKNGEIVRPFVKVRFIRVATVSASGQAIALYEEAEISEFDPTGLEPVQVRSLDKDFEELNVKPAKELAA